MYLLENARRSSSSHKEASIFSLNNNLIGAQTIYLEQIRFLTNRVKELEREKDVFNIAFIIALNRKSQLIQRHPQ